MRFGALALLGVCACGRIGFDTPADSVDASRCAHPPRLVQSACVNPDARVVSLSDVTPGNVIVVEIEYDDILARVTSVSDGLSNPYAVHPLSPVRSSSQSSELWYAGVAHGGDPQIAVTTSGDVSGLSIHAQEYAGLDLSTMTTPFVTPTTGEGMAMHADTAIPVAGSLVVAHAVSTSLVFPAPNLTMRAVCNGNQIGDAVVDALTFSTDFTTDADVPWIVELDVFPAACD